MGKRVVCESVPTGRAPQYRFGPGGAVLKKQRKRESAERYQRASMMPSPPDHKNFF